MPNRSLAIALAAMLALAAAIDISLAVGLAFAHKPFVLPLVTMSALIPGIIAVSRAWRGRLVSRCAAPR